MPSIRQKSILDFIDKLGLTQAKVAKGMKLKDRNNLYHHLKVKDDIDIELYSKIMEYLKSLENIVLDKSDNQFNIQTGTGSQDSRKAKVINENHNAGIPSDMANSMLAELTKTVGHLRREVEKKGKELQEQSERNAYLLAAIKEKDERLNKLHDLFDKKFRELADHIIEHDKECKKNHSTTHQNLKKHDKHVDKRFPKVDDKGGED